MSWERYSIGVFVIALGCLACGVLAVWGDFGHMTVEMYKLIRTAAAGLVSVHAAASVGRLAFQPLDAGHKREFGGYLGFWVLVPPVWFFLEYFAVASDDIIGFAGTPDNLKQIKDFADYASKIWAAIVTFLTGVVALKKVG